MADYNPAELDQEQAAQWREQIRAARQEARDAGTAASTTSSEQSLTDPVSALKHRMDPRAIAAGTIGGPLGWVILAVWKTLGWVHKK